MSIPPKRPVAFLLWFLWTLAMCVAFAGAAFGLAHNPDKSPEVPTWQWLLVWTMPSAAVICGWLALSAGNALWRALRVVFWAAALGGAALAGALFQGRMEVSGIAGDHQLLLVGALLPVLPVIFMVVRGVRSGGLKSVGFGWLMDIPLGFVCLAVALAGVWFFMLKTRVEPLRLKADRRWAEIGHPMAEFEKSLEAVGENESLQDLTADLKPFGAVDLYKTTDNRSTIQTPPELTELYVGAATMPGDRFREVPKASAWLDAHAADFDHLYQGVLQRDPPVWSCNPEEGLYIRVPNFGAIRNIEELICADAYRRIEKNDTKGAPDAISAGLRIVRNLGDQPLMVSFMTYVNIQAMYAPVIARLPLAQDDMQRLAGEVAESRRQYARAVQWEGWNVMHIMDNGARNLDDLHADPHKLFPLQPLPAWLGRKLMPVYRQSFGRYYYSEDWLYEADLVRISGQVEETAGADFGAGEMDASNVTHRTPLIPNWSRAWLRVNFMLLIREQAVAIRYARAQMQAGTAAGELKSVVIPGAKWKIAGNAEEGYVTVALTPTPPWAEDTSVMGDKFFMMPLDGKRPWMLRPAVKQQ